MGLEPRNAALAAFLLGPVISIQAYCEVFMSEEKAVEAIFPGRAFTKTQLLLTAEQRQKIATLSGEAARSDSLTVWKSTDGEWVVIDRVIGKHEFITFAVGIGKNRKIKGVEVLEYKEAYGGQVRGENWRAQFAGKDVTAPLQVDQDIKNISGATLSSTHLSAGVRRILRTYDIVNR